MIRTAFALAALAVAALAAPAGAQDWSGVTLRPEPSSLSLEAGGSAPLTVTAHDASGAEVEVTLRYAAPRSALRVRDGVVEALAAGSWEIVASVVVSAESEVAPPTVRIPVTVEWPSVSRIEVLADEGRLHVGTRVDHRARAFHADGSQRPEAAIEWSSSDESVARVTSWGTVEGTGAGTATITAALEGARESFEVEVAPFDVASMRLTGGADEARTGETLTFEVDARDAAGAAVDGLSVTWSATFVPDDSIQAPGAGALVRDGRFVGEVPGRYEVFATAGERVARRTIDVRPREAIHEVEFTGQGGVRHVHTSDLWVFEGTDGRDYAITGTWGGDGVAYFWDVTDPATPMVYDSIQVDARTVNDVKVSPDGRWGALSREGASNRRNGVVILDLADPRNPRVAATYDQGLTGGVHNMFATNEHLFALSGGDKYVILDMSDLDAPAFVSEYNHPDSRIHDVWVHDGVAYSSEWGTGVVVVDVGNGRWGGTIDNPVFVTSVPYPVGRTHAAFPYVQESTGKVYLFLGDEILSRTGAAFAGYGSDDPWDPATGEGGVQAPTSGYIHIIDFTDPENPEDVARYEVPEFGTHNLWVEDDVLYVAYYEGGLRVVDVEGELLGNLATQGREMAVFKAFDPQGFLVNSPNAWGPQPYKGHVFFSDFNSGLWSVRIVPKDRPIS
ncbi:Ig-like domain-containing protein [Gaopeijia maritima]|uniref:Ig-like domain-containing protein n=2 Tax=Gaopeijia maritima TaxID=3119007 RepID=A0ABU9EB07_9BACT